MSLTEATLEGTIQSDGTLVLDEPTSLPAGRVTVVVQQKTSTPEANDETNAFWGRMEKMWSTLEEGGYTPRTAEEIDQTQKEMRDGWHKHQLEIESLQRESQGE